MNSQLCSDKGKSVKSVRINAPKSAPTFKSEMREQFYVTVLDELDYKLPVVVGDDPTD